MFKFCEKGAAWGTLFLRLALGITFIAHGGQKVGGLFGGPGLEATIQGFQAHLGLPALVAVLVSYVEFLGGIALVLGLFTRIAALGIGIVMIGAIVTVHFQNGFFMNWYLVPEVGHGFEYHLLAIAMSFALVFSGGGRCSVDGAFACLQKSKLQKHSYEERPTS